MFNNEIIHGDNIIVRKCATITARMFKIYPRFLLFLASEELVDFYKALCGSDSLFLWSFFVIFKKVKAMIIVICVA